MLCLHISAFQQDFFLNSHWEVAALFGKQFCRCLVQNEVWHIGAIRKKSAIRQVYIQIGTVHGINLAACGFFSICQLTIHSQDWTDPLYTGNLQLSIQIDLCAVCGSNQLKRCLLLCIELPGGL